MPGGDDAILHREVGRGLVSATAVLGNALKSIAAFVLCLALLGAAGPARALGITLSSANGNPGGSVETIATVVNDGDNTSDANFTITYDTNNFTPSFVQGQNGASCSAGGGTISVLVMNGSPVPTESVCRVFFDVGPATPDGMYPLTISMANCTDSATGMPTTCNPSGAFFNIGAAGTLQCPQTVVSGNNQSGPPGSTLPQALVAKSVITGATVQPPAEQFIWSVDSGDAVFVSNNTNFLTTFATYVNTGGTTWEATDSQQLKLGTTLGAVQVSLTTEGCGSPGGANFTETIAADTPPMLNYTPSASTNVAFSGVTGVGSTGNGQITVTPTGGSGAGETDVANCVFSGGNATAFSVTSAQPLKFIGSTVTPQNITMQCVAQASVLTSTLNCDENIVGAPRGAQRHARGGIKAAQATQSWPVSCPAATPDAPPTVTYSPSPGNNVFLNDGSGSIFVSSNADGSGTSAQATTTIHNCSISGGSATSFQAPTFSPNPLSFVGNTAGSGTIGLTCTQSEFDTTANLACSETRGSTTAAQNWTLTCLSLPTAPPNLAFNPNDGGTVNFNGVSAPGSTGTGTITISPSGGSGAGSNGTTTFDNCSIGGTDASAFAVTTTLPLTFQGSSTTSQFLSMSCTSGTAALTASLSCQEHQSDFPPKPHGWTLACPPGNNNAVKTMSKVSGDGQSGFARDVLQPVVVELDDSGLPIPARVKLNSRPSGPKGVAPGVQVSFDISGDARFATGSASATVTSDAQGQASSPAIQLGVTPGSIVIIASATGYPGQVFNLTLRSAGTMTAVSGDNQVGTPGQAGQPLIIALTDSGSPIVNEPITWSIFSGSGVTLETNSTTTDNAGHSQIGISFASGGADALIQATSAHGATFVFHVRAVVQQGAPQFRVLSGANQTGPVGSQADNPLVFEYFDANGQPVFNSPIDFAVESGSATLSAPSALTDSAGHASVRVRFGPTAGPIVVSGANAAAGVRATANFTSFVPGFAVASGNNQSAPAGTRLPQPLVVSIAPSGAAQPKGLGGVTVTWSVLAGGGTLASVTTTTNASGQSSNDFTLGANPGANRVQATIAGVGSVVFTETGTAPENASLEIVSGNNQSLGTNTDSAALVVRLHLPDGAGVNGVCIAWTGSNGVTVSDSTTTTGSDGRTSITARLSQPGAATVQAAPCQNASTSVTFALNGAVAAIPTLTPAQQTIATAIDNACPALFSRMQGGQTLTTEQRDLLARCTEVVVSAGSQPTAVATALDQMVADESQSQRTAALTANNTQFSNVTARLLALRNGVRGASFNGLALAAPSGTLPLSFLPSVILAGAGDDDTKKSDEVGKDFSRLGFFATGTLGHGRRDNTAQTPGFDFDTWGMTAGLDYRYTDSFVFGAALGYNKNNTDISRDRGGLDVHGWSFSGYGTYYRGESFYADAVLSFGSNSYDLTRRIHYTINSVTGGTTNVDQTVSASPNGDQRSFGLSLGRDFNRGAWSFGPYGRLTYAKLGFDSYTERASQPNAPGAGLVVSVDGRDITSLQSVLGGKLSRTISTSWGVLIPHVQGEYLHEFRDDPVDVVTYFANDPTHTPIVINGERTDPDYFNIGLGVSGIFANGRSAFIYYEHRAGERRLTQDSIALGLRLEF